MNLELAINDEAMVASLVEKGELLQAAVLEAVGSLGVQLWDRATGKIAAVVRTAIGEAMLESIYLEAAQWVDAACSTSVGILPSGDPSYIVAYVREFGGEKWYDIYPLEATLGQLSDAGIGAGIKSPFSSHDQVAWNESRLPHALAWIEGGSTVFAKHIWHPPAEERSYLRSSLAEMQEQIKDEISGAIAGVLAA